MSEQAERIDWLIHCLDDSDCGRLFNQRQIAEMLTELRQLSCQINYELPVRFQEQEG